MKRFRLLLPLIVILALFGAVAVQATPGNQTIVEIALAVNADTGEFSTLIAALQAAGLVDTFNGRGQYTVFAPTDAAFAKLGLDASNIGTLDKATLTNILQYHVTTGNRAANSIVNARQLRMLNRQFTTVTVNSEGAFINSSKLIATDISASNGYIHVIDTVLLPQ